MADDLWSIDRVFRRPVGRDGPWVDPVHIDLPDFAVVEFGSSEVAEQRSPRTRSHLSERPILVRSHTWIAGWECGNQPQFVAVARSSSP